MKIIRFAFFLLALLLIKIAYTQAKQSCSAIHIYRSKSLSNAWVPLKIYVNNKEIKSLNNNAVLKILIPTSGTYEISARWDIRGETYRMNTIKHVDIICENPETYIKVKSGTLQAGNLLTIVHHKNGKNDIKKIDSNNFNTFNLQGIDQSTSTKQEIPHIVGNKENKNELDTSLEKDSFSKKEINSSNELKNKTVGKYYALIIGVNQYQDYNMNDLDQPIADATKLVDVLLRKYTFVKENLLFLKNPTKGEITKALDNYFEKLNSNDNLFIFYAGHGYWDEKFQQGYWLATDADKENRGTWLSNGTIRDYIRAIPSKHTLLVTDACFGGGIFKGRSAFTNASTAIDELYKLPSRKAMTSGAMKEVPDKSVFIQYLVKRLEQNQEKHLSSEQLFASFKIAVINNSSNNQVPQFGEIKETGDEGGDYIFIKK